MSPVHASDVDKCLLASCTVTTVTGGGILFERCDLKVLLEWVLVVAHLGRLTRGPDLFSCRTQSLLLSKGNVEISTGLDSSTLKTAVLPCLEIGI